ncbi:ATP-binding protein [Nonomuraea sp. NPDC049637]|uniref:AlbA family DNA-binding domain-containing protein n=1 Tax=Nonomuraea sp. NPDC049637 TaxID=3154356 RepID=UPI00344943A5
MPLVVANCEDLARDEDVHSGQHAQLARCFRPGLEIRHPQLALSTMMNVVSLIQALLHAAPTQVTMDRIRQLVKLVGPEAPTVEYKADMAQSIAAAVAALANTYGGLVLVGVSDRRVITGVKEKTIEAVAEHCHSKIEPPWVPDIVPVPMDDGSGRFVLVLRVAPGLTPRPLLVDGAAPIRSHSTTHPASWQQLAALFAENDMRAQADPWSTQRPDIPVGAGGTDERVDLVLRSGLNIAVDPRAAWRPLGEQHADRLAEALSHSLLPAVLSDLVSLGADCGPFERRGHNRSRVIRLYWQAPAPDRTRGLPVPVEALLTAEVPGGYGHQATHLRVHLDVTTRLAHWDALQEAEWQPVSGRTKPPAEQRLMSIEALELVIGAMISTLVDERVVGALAGLAFVDALTIAQPRVLHMVTSRPIPQVLDTRGLTQIPGAGNSTGVHMLADPGLDLADPEQRHGQVRSWLIQTALDAGLLGMEQRLRDRPRPPDAG